MIRTAIEETVERNAAKYHEIAAGQLVEGEQLVGAYPAEQCPPFVLRILPYVGVFFRRKFYLLAVTDRRLLLIRLRTPFLLSPPAFWRVEASIPLRQLGRVGSNGTGVDIGTRAGKVYSFNDMFLPDAVKLSVAVKVARQAARELPETDDEPVPSFEHDGPDAGGLFRILARIGTGLFGAFLLLGAIGGLLSGDVGMAVVVMLLATGMLTLSIRVLRPRPAADAGKRGS
jgi:hypothetical protein